MSHVAKLVRSQGLALLAMLLVLTGGAVYAAGLAKNSVNSSHIKNGKVKTTDLKDGAVTGAKIGLGSVPGDRLIHHSVTGGGITSNAVTRDKVLDESLSGFDVDRGSIYAADLAPDNVGSSEIKSPRVVVSIGYEVPAGQTGLAYAFCTGGEQVIGGGAAWQIAQPGTSILSSTPEQTQAGVWMWVGAGRPTTDNTLFAWALCMPF